MASKFQCEKCGGEIVVKYAKPGDEVLCRNCGAHVEVPRTGGEGPTRPKTRPHRREGRSPGAELVACPSCGSDKKTAILFWGVPWFLRWLLPRRSEAVPVKCDKCGKRFDGRTGRPVDDVMGRANTIRFVYVAGVVLVGFSCAVCSILGIPDLLIRRPAYTCELKGDACYERIDYEGALKWYERGLAFEPERYFLLCGKAKALRELGRYEEAVEIFGRATELKPERWTAPYGKAKILSDLGRWEEAAESYGDALKSFDDEFPETRYRAYGGRIRALKELGRMDEALAAYDEALTHFPEDGFLRRGKARLLIKLGRYDDPSLGSLRRREAVALIMDAYKKDVDPIYNKYLGADAALAGKLSVRCEVATSGAVTACSVESSTLGNAAMEREVCRHIRAWRFPPGGEESCTVVYRFVFTAAGAD